MSKDLTCSFCGKEINNKTKNWGFLTIKGTKLDVNYHCECKELYDSQVNDSLIKQIARKKYNTRGIYGECLDTNYTMGYNQAIEDIIKLNKEQ